MKLIYKLLIVVILFVAIISVSAYSYYSPSTSLSYNPFSSNLNYNALQNIDKSQSNYTFVVYGDDQDSNGKFNQLINTVNEKNILFSIDIGDLVPTGNLTEYQTFLIQINSSKSPILTAIGNHELKQDTNGSYYINFFGNRYYSFSTKNSYFIILDDANEIGLDDQQMQWLKTELNKSQSYKYRFVFMHVPLYDPRNESDIKNDDEHSLGDVNQAKELNDLFDQYNVTMLFSSHIHAYYNGTWGKTPYIITGGAGAPLAKVGPEHSFYHYILITVSNQRVNFELIKY
jgi:serine/threonine-protein phosphatase CPPED1